MVDSISYIDSWKNKEVFQDQLALNEKELNHYPDHWKHFINTILSLGKEKKYKLLDIGCGVGTYKEICRTHFPNISYTGKDYSQEAIDIAKKRWGGTNWVVGDYQSITKHDAEVYDILHAGAMLDVLPNGNEALSFLLGLGFNHLILGRVKITEKDSGFIEYEVYNKIRTYAYSHNIKTLETLFGEAGYSATFTGENNSCTILLQKIQ